MKPSFALLPALLLGFAVGCQYEPLDYAANSPELDEAVKEIDRVVYGESRLIYRDRNNTDRIRCTITHEIEGWRGADDAPEECPDCTETFTFFRAVDDKDGDCGSIGVPQTFNAGITTVAAVIAEDENRGPWMEEQGAVAALRTTWVVHSFTSVDPLWRVRNGLFEVDEDDWPDTPGSVEEWARVYSARDRYSYGIEIDNVEYSVLWQMDLQFTE